MKFDSITIKSLDHIFQAIDEVVFLIDQQGTFKHVVRTSQDFLLLPPSEFIGKHHREVLPEPISDQIEESFKRLSASETLVSFEYSLNVGNGTDWFIARIGKITDDNGSLVGYVAMIRKITYKKSMESGLVRKEKMLEAIAFANKELLENTNLTESISNGIRELGIATGADRCYLFENGFDDEMGEETTSQKYEWNSGSAAPQINNPDLQNLPFSAVSDFVEPMTKRVPLNAIVRELPDGGLKEALAAQDIVSVLLMPIYVQDYFWGFVGFDDCYAERVWSESEINLLKSYAVSISSAISRKSMEDDLKRSKEIAESANNAKSAFLANISHEIRTPLNGVVGFTSLLSDTELSEEQRLFVNNLKASSAVLHSLIADILDFSKIDAGIIEIIRSQTELRTFVSEIENILRYQFSKDGNQLILNIDPSIPEYILVDSIKLKQVLVNLLSNGSKFTSKGVVTLSIVPQNEVLRFEVKDTGIGIKPEDLKTIFNPFVQGDLSRTKKYQGSGLGLSISKKILEAMNSEIHVESEPGKGSTFYFDLRDYEVVEQENVQAENLSGERTYSDLKKFKLKILIVDDNEMNILLASMVTRKNYPESEIFLAANGFEALEKVRQSDFSIIFLDLHMPGIDGFQTYQKMKALRPDLCPVVALTADASETAKQKCLDTGMHGILIKPFSPKELNDMVVKCIG
jgi:PAS domain S-box-containing protein